jgi:hypothetical protein
MVDDENDADWKDVHDDAYSEDNDSDHMFCATDKDVAVEREVQAQIPKVSRRTEPSDQDISLITRWKELLPSLVDPYLEFVATTSAKPDTSLPSPQLETKCKTGTCVRKEAFILCLFQNCMFLFQSLGQTRSALTTKILDCLPAVKVTFCTCQPLPTVLLSHGLFPSSPSQPRIGVCLHLLDFYRALFERSCEAINALAAALNTHYRRRGFRLLNHVVCFLVYLR